MSLRARFCSLEKNTVMAIRVEFLLCEFVEFFCKTGRLRVIGMIFKTSFCTILQLFFGNKKGVKLQMNCLFVVLTLVYRNVRKLIALMTFCDFDRDIMTSLMSY